MPQYSTVFQGVNNGVRLRTRRSQQTVHNKNENKTLMQPLWFWSLWLLLTDKQTLTQGQGWEYSQYLPVSVFHLTTKLEMLSGFHPLLKQPKGALWRWLCLKAERMKSVSVDSHGCANLLSQSSNMEQTSKRNQVISYGLHKGIPAQIQKDTNTSFPHYSA